MTSNEGFLTKGRSGRFAESNDRRWFKSSGFSVAYFKDARCASLKGQFDLRDVVSIEPVTDRRTSGALGWTPLC